LSIVKLICGKITLKLEINWQNFAQVRLPLTFAFRKRPKIKLSKHNYSIIIHNQNFLTPMGAVKCLKNHK